MSFEDQRVTAWQNCRNWKKLNAPSKVLTFGFKKLRFLQNRFLHSFSSFISDRKCESVLVLATTSGVWTRTKRVALKWGTLQVLHPSRSFFYCSNNFDFIVAEFKRSNYQKRLLLALISVTCSPAFHWFRYAHPNS